MIVFSASNSSTTNTTENTLSPTVDIALGALALVGACERPRRQIVSFG